MFQTLNPHARQGGQEGFSHDQIVAKNSGSIVSGAAVTSLRPVRIPPSAPTIYSTTVGLARATVYFRAPTAAGSSPITSYKVTSSPGGIIVTGKASPLTVTGLTPGTPYKFSVVATSSDGSSAPTFSSTVIPIDRPGSPTVVSVTPGNRSVTVSFTAPTYTGGTPITSYQVWAESSDGGQANFIIGSPTSTSLTVSNLTNDKTYTIRVHARNIAGISLPTITPSVIPRAVAVTIITVPEIPNAVSAIPDNGKATVYFTAPTNNGGAPITSYTVTSNPPGSTMTTTDGSPVTLFGLTNGIYYTFSVVATNSRGSSSPAYTNPVLPATVPGPPTAVFVTSGSGFALVSFAPPTYNGGDPVTSYTVTSNVGGFKLTTSSSPINLFGLTNGTPYIFSVVATNSRGSSTPVVTDPVTPIDRPGVPTAVSATHGNRSATVYFTAPINTGGLPITGYTVTSSPGGFTATGTTSPIIVSGLNNGTPYTFSVVARNNNGSSPQANTATVIPSTVPGRPNGVYATPGVGKATVTFYTPSTDGGAPITGYTVTSSPGGFTATGTTAGTAYPYIITGLTNGTPYTFSIVATNINGASISAKTFEVTPATVPLAPTNVSVTVGDWETSVSFTAPADDGGSPVIAYTLSATPVGESTVSSVVTRVASPITVTGLTSGTSYIFSVVAVNSIGDSAPASSGIVTPVFVDRITASLTPASLEAYQGVSNDEWIKITAAEYTDLQENVTGTTKAGITDELINYPGAEDARTNYLTTDKTLLVANGITTGTPAIPANTYLYAFAISWVNTVAESSEGMRVYTNVEKIGGGGYYQAGGVLPATTPSGMSYYVRKGVATTNGDADGTLACFSGTSSGSGAYIGIKLLGSTTYTPIPTMSYRTFNGNDVPAPNTGTAQGLAGVGVVVLQGLATPKKQWN